ncbi:MAG: type II toxin-antitoxin system RelE/ParE family toxin [Gammaproteobacteria bacterium]|nr:type II toxin-antitoxin system RelE/ParE family toxin [Gammaproteobacteria bacterium]
MTVYRIEFSCSAAKALRDLERKTQVRIWSRLRLLAENPRPHDVKKLQGAENVYRVREGDYRIVYEIHDKKLLIHVLRVGHRREIYR